MKAYSHILASKKQKRKLFSVLIDPDKQDKNSLLKIIKTAEDAKVDFFFLGGSLLTYDNLNNCIVTIKKLTKIPVILFPGNTMQINHKADGILFLSLISGRNADMLIGKQVITAPILKQSSLEVMSTGYMLIDGGKQTTVSYISNTTPIPSNKPAISACTAIAGEMLGLKLIFMDAGSGAENPVSLKMIETVSKSIDIPLIIGGGIKSANQARKSCEAGADIIVVGNAIEKKSDLIKQISSAVHDI